MVMSAGLTGVHSGRSERAHERAKFLESEFRPVPHLLKEGGTALLLCPVFAVLLVYSGVGVLYSLSPLRATFILGIWELRGEV
jgi:hypothetical protein